MGGLDYYGTGILLYAWEGLDYYGTDILLYAWEGLDYYALALLYAWEGLDYYALVYCCMHGRGWTIKLMPAVTAPEELVHNKLIV